LTLQQLADAFGYMGTAYLSRVETGKMQPSLDVAIKMADFFGVTVDQLVRDDVKLDLRGEDQ
jgi:transcriptional regulator with XRE-family HTH domain